MWLINLDVWMPESVVTKIDDLAKRKKVAGHCLFGFKNMCPNNYTLQNYCLLQIAVVF